MLPGYKWCLSICLLSVFCTALTATAHQLNQTVQAEYSESGLLLSEFISKGPASLVWQHYPEYEHVSGQCLNSMDEVRRSVLLGRQWAFKLLGSNPGSLGGLLDDQCFHAGDYDQCLDVTAWNGTSVIFHGQHFLATSLPDEKLMDLTGLENGLPLSVFQSDAKQSIRLKLGILFRFPRYFTLKNGICLPSTCTQEDAVQLLNQTMNRYSWNLLNVAPGNLRTNMKGMVSELSEKRPFAWYTLITYLSVIVLLSLVDFLKLTSFMGLTVLQNIVRATSIKQNFKILTSPISEEEAKNPLFDSIRYIITFAMLSYHVVFYGGAQTGILMYKSFYSPLKYADNAFFHLLLSDAGFPILFIIASGTFSSKMVKIAKLKPSFVDLLKEMLIRWLKYVPTIAVMLLLEICIPYLYAGPLVKEEGLRLSNNCFGNGWRSLLLIQNFNDPQDICMVHTWTIAAEFQLLIISCFLTYIYGQSERLGVLVNILLVVGGLIGNFCYAYAYEFRSMFFQFPINFDSAVVMSRFLHFNSLSHVYCYFFIYLMIYLGSNLKKMPFTPAIRTVISILLFVGVNIFPLTANLFAQGYEGSRFTSTLIMILNRAFLPLTMGWIALTVYSQLGRKPSAKIEQDWLVRWAMGFMKPVLRVKANQADQSSSKSDSKPTEKETKTVKKGAKLIQEEDVKLVEKTDVNKSLDNQSGGVVRRSNWLHQLTFKLVRSLYLSHHFLLIYLYLSIQDPIPFTLYAMLCNIQTFMLQLVPIALLFYLFVDAPTMNLAGQLIKKLKRNQYQKVHKE